MAIRESETILIENWYEVKQLESNVLAIGEPKHQEEVFSYLVKGENKDLLIDTGMGVVPITHALEKVRNSTKPLDVVNTHWHFDHVGGNSHFEKVLVPKNVDEVTGLLKGWSHEDLQRYGFFDGFHSNGDSTIPLNFDMGYFSIPGSKNICPALTDGYTFDLGDRAIEVIETPGHTPGGISLFDKTNGLLFTSDLLYEGPLYAFEEESDPGKYLRSLAKIKKTLDGKIQRIHPGHNNPENICEPNLLNDAIKLFRMARRKITPDDISHDFPRVVEYRCPGISRRNCAPRRLKVLVSEDYIKQA